MSSAFLLATLCAPCRALAKLRQAAALLIVFLNFGCSSPHSASYREQYAHLRLPAPKTEVTQSPFFIIFLVNAPHLDYSDNYSFLRTMAKHPDTWSKEGDVGHAWIYVHGIRDGTCFVLEGGHSGETGQFQPRYFEGIMQYVDSHCENPISYLWETQHDGFFQKGNGGHKPTLAVKVNLTEDQYNKILRFVACYLFEEYALTGNQCASFIAQIGELIDFPIACHATVAIDSSIEIGSDRLQLWSDPSYSAITVSTPDIIEKSLLLAIQEGRAENVTSWYLKIRQGTFKRTNFRMVPLQVERFLYFCL